MATKLPITTVALVSAVALGAAAIWLTHADSPKREPAGAAAQTQTQAQTQTPTPTSAPASVASAQSTSSTPVSSSSSTPASHAQATAPAGGAAQQAFIDPKTGQLRPAEHDEVAAAAAAAAAKTNKLARTAAAAAPQEIFGPGGAIGVAVPEDLQTYTVATRNPDGTITMKHVTGPKAADKAVREASKKKGGAVQNKEERNDR